MPSFTKNLVIFASILCMTIALELKFEENGRNYTETIMIDEENNIVEYVVPNHGKVLASKYLVDYDSGYNVMKIDVQKICYVMDIKSSEPTTKQVKLGLKKTNGTFPIRHIIETNKIFALHKMDPSRLTWSILAFCGDYPIMKAIYVQNLEEVEKSVLKELQRKLKVKRKRRAIQEVITEFVACNPSTHAGEIVKCGFDMSRIDITCKTQPRTCVYEVACTALPDGTGWDCPNHHVFTITFCCDLKCNRPPPPGTSALHRVINRKVFQPVPVQPIGGGGRTMQRERSIQRERTIQSERAIQV